MAAGIVAKIVNANGLIQAGAGKNAQTTPRTTAQLSTKENDTNADSFREVAKEISGNIRQRANALVNNPNPNVCPKEIAIVPDQRAR
jgi:hypothetical protein